MVDICTGLIHGRRTPFGREWRSGSAQLRTGPYDAGVVELVDAPDSKSGSARSAGSTPATRTNTKALELTNSNTTIQRAFP